MNRVNGVYGVVVPMNRASKSGVVTSQPSVFVWVRTFFDHARAMLSAWNEKWREQAVRAAEMERVRLKEQARLHDRLPMVKWHGYY